MRPTPRAITPSAETICWGLVLMFVGGVIFQLGLVQASGWVIVGGFIDLAGIVILITGVYWMATNVDLAARAALEILTQPPAFAYPGSSSSPAPRGSDQWGDGSRIAGSTAVREEPVDLAEAAPTEGIATQMTRLTALRDDGTITAEQFAAEKRRVLRAWSGR